MRRVRQGKNECFPASVCALFDLDWEGEIRPRFEQATGTTWADCGRDRAVAVFLSIVEPMGVPRGMAEGAKFRHAELPGRGRLPKRFPIPQGRGLLCIRAAPRTVYYYVGERAEMTTAKARLEWAEHPEKHSQMRCARRAGGAHVVAFENGKLYDPDSEVFELTRNAATAVYGRWRVVKVIRTNGVVERFGQAKEIPQAVFDSGAWY